MFDPVVDAECSSFKPNPTVFQLKGGPHNFVMAPTATNIIQKYWSEAIVTKRARASDNYRLLRKKLTPILISGMKDMQGIHGRSQYPASIIS